MSFIYLRLKSWWQSRRLRFYRKNRWHLAIDVFMSIILLLLLAVVLRLAFYQPLIDVKSLSISQHQPAFDYPLAISCEASLDKSSVLRGEKLKISVHCSNESARAIDYFAVNWKSDSAAFALNNFSVIDGEAVFKDGLLIANPISAGADKYFKLEADWLEQQTDAPRTITSSFNWQAKSGLDSLSGSFKAPLFTIKSDLTLQAAVYYHSPQGDQLGVGPVPPIVGLPTTYWVILRAENKGNNLANFVASAKLPSNVELSGEESLLAGKLEYDKSNRRLIWRVDALSANGGDYVANIGIIFNPSSLQVGRKAVLLENIKYHADDLLAEEEIGGSLSSLDTSLPQDRINRGNGEVQPE